VNLLPRWPLIHTEPASVHAPLFDTAQDEGEGVRFWYHRLLEESPPSTQEGTQGRGLLEGGYSVGSHVAAMVRNMSRRYKTRR
jgi:hypothetical protein